VAIPPAGSDMGSLNSDRRFPHLILSRAFLFQLSKNLTPIPQPGSHRLTGADLLRLYLPNGNGGCRCRGALYLLVWVQPC
jgi:hypothetical protein